MKASAIRRLLQAIYKPMVVDPQFKERVLRHLLSEVGPRRVSDES